MKRRSERWISSTATDKQKEFYRKLTGKDGETLPEMTRGEIVQKISDALRGPGLSDREIKMRRGEV